MSSHLRQSLRGSSQVNTSVADIAGSTTRSAMQSTGIIFRLMMLTRRGAVSNIQTCETLLHQSGGQFPGTSLFELYTLEGIPLNKLAIGKLASPADGISSVPGAQDTPGYMPPEALKVCSQIGMTNQTLCLAMACWKSIFRAGVSRYNRSLR